MLVCLFCAFLLVQFYFWTGNMVRLQRHEEMLEISQLKMMINPRHDCALLFFGLPKRFSDIVYPSIQENILQYNPHCDIFAHSYDVPEITSSRNREYGIPLRTDVLRIMTPHIRIDPADPLPHNMTYYRQFYGWRTRSWEYPTSMDNMIKQWHSIAQVWDLMHNYSNAQNKSYAQVALFRPDVLYRNPIDIFDGPAFMPHFGWPANDRMFAGTYDNAKIWSTRRFASLDGALRNGFLTKGLHSESYIAEVILPQMHDRVERRTICFQRVRATGHIRRDDCWNRRITFALERLWEFLWMDLIPTALRRWWFRHDNDDGRPDISIHGIS
jgi:hypothetical protein